MRWETRLKSKPSAAMLAPPWFTAARASGCSEAQLLEKVRAFCAELSPNPSEDWVRLMHGMYEAACKNGEGAA